MTRIVFYGPDLLPSHRNGAAAYFCALLGKLTAIGYDIAACPATASGLRHSVAEAAKADVVIMASDGGDFDHELLAGVLALARPEAVRLFWDTGTPITLQALRSDELHPLRRALPHLDGVLTNGGGPPVVAAYRALKAWCCVPVYNGFDPAMHHPSAAEHRFAGDLGFLGSCLPDRETRVEEFFLAPARRMTERRFMLGGSGWGGKPVPSNVTTIGHLTTQEQNTFNRSCRAVLNIARESVAAAGFSPSARVFEAAGAGACLITDHWDGIGYFLKPGEQVLIARDGKDVADHLASLTPERAREIGLSALEHVLMHHTYANRAAEVNAMLRSTLQHKREMAAA